MITATEKCWAQTAGLQVKEALKRHDRWPAIHKRGALVTARTCYRSRTIPTHFRMRVVPTSVGSRRLLSTPGKGRPLLILPGLYARINEGLFLDLAEQARKALGRPISLLEDRFAPGTLRLNPPRIPTIRELGREVGDIARGPIRGQDDARPDLLALSAGAAWGLAAPEGTFAKAAVWSSALQPQAVLSWIRRNPPLEWYFKRLHQRSFREGGVSPIGMKQFSEAISRDCPSFEPKHPLLAVHANDDPIAPAHSLKFGSSRTLFVCLVGTGGHLGFGELAGNGVYLLPFKSLRAGTALSRNRPTMDKPSNRSPPRPSPI